MSPDAAVLRIVSAARRLAEREGAPRASLVASLVATTGLSPEGVELGLARHLEIDPSPEEIASLVASAAPTREVAVVLSANVFVGALRAIALARAASERVRVRPSRREPAFARALVAELGDPAVVLDEALAVEDLRGGELHVYGHDATISDVRRKVAPGVLVRGHGSGLGVAWVTRAADLEPSASALASDVVPFDQQGCLSPRVVLVEGDAARARALGEALHGALTELGRRVPRGEVPVDVRASAAMWSASLAYAGEVLEGADHVVAVADEAAPAALPPTHRHVLVVPIRDAAALAVAVAPLAHAVVAFGCDDDEAARAVAPAWSRRSRLGAMQRPRLDGPVDGRPAR